jgi:hypothetical protein
MIRHVMYTYRAKWWYGKAWRERERNKREMATDMFLTGVQRARGPGPASSLPFLSLSFRWLGWGCRAQLTLLAFLSIYLYLSFFVCFFLVGRAGRISSLFFLSK